MFEKEKYDLKLKISLSLNLKSIFTSYGQAASRFYQLIAEMGLAKSNSIL